MNEYQVGQILSKNMEYLALSPCSVNMFKSIRERVDKMKTINHLNFGDFALVGALNEYYVNIYHHEPKNTEILKGFPKKNNNLGICSNFPDFSEEWKKVLYGYTSLENLMLSSPAETLSAVIAALV